MLYPFPAAPYSPFQGGELLDSNRRLRRRGECKKLLPSARGGGRVSGRRGIGKKVQISGIAMADSCLNNHPEQKLLRRKLRSRLTPAEARLWLYLKNKQLDGRRFRRQYSFGNFVVDFYCPSELLAVELDGQVHLTAKGIKRDQLRDAYLAHCSIRVLRFVNAWVFTNADGVLKKITEQFGWDERGEKPGVICFYTPSPLRGTPPLQGESP